jgi:hypothetical protein
MTTETTISPETKAVLEKIKVFCFDGGTDNSPSADSMDAYRDVSKFCDQIVSGGAP